MPLISPLMPVPPVIVKCMCSNFGLLLADSPRTKAGGLAFEVILKPAAADNPPQISANSPTKERSISQEFIEKKLKDAEERRQVLLLIPRLIYACSDRVAVSLNMAIMSNIMT